MAWFYFHILILIHDPVDCSGILASILERVVTVNDDNQDNTDLTSNLDDQLNSSHMQTDEEFLEQAFMNSNVKIRFGLEQQGHIPVIEKMLDRHCG